MQKNELPPLRRQRFRIIAQDPSIRVKGKILTALVDVPAEELGPGPWGHRVQVIDYDASTQTLYQPLVYSRDKNKLLIDPFRQSLDKRLLSDPHFHAQNVYAIVMRILARFEFALGRRISWGFKGHQLKVAPHAFADANAFYSDRDESLMFGYFPGAGNRTVFSCLSHDVIAHETTHALVDGLRERYTDPSSPDQAGFHEGFSDLVALLSIFAIPEVVEMAVDLKWRERNKQRRGNRQRNTSLISIDAMHADELRESVIAAMAEQMGEEISKVHGQPLRASATLKPSPKWYRDSEEYQEPHRRGEILVAAMINGFLEVWINRLQALDPMNTGWMDRGRAVEEGACIADRLLTMCIRALDYCPPVHLEYGDFLSSLLTADHELHPDDSLYHLRQIIRDSFHAYGIEPASIGEYAEPGLWVPPENETPDVPLNYSRTHFESMLRDPEEVFRFIWENRKSLGLFEGAYTRVQSVRPCLRIGEDGFALHETVADYIQILRLTAKEIRAFGVPLPEGLPPEPTEIFLYGGGVLLFDEYGRMKFHIHNHINDFAKQGERLKSLVRYGFFNKGASALRRFSHMHRMRSLNIPSTYQEGWN
jgi:hypothetical protein